MSSITSSTYPTVTVSKSGDLFAIVRNGQLMKMNRQALTDYINELAPNTLISLQDTPVSYVGQQGKALVVAPGEEGMVFEAATAGNFLALSDTPANYGGNAGKLAVVNSGETALEFIDNFFIQLGDTPANYTGASEKIVRVNTGATAVEFVTPTEAAPARNLTGGWFDYDHAGSTQAYSSTGTFVKVLNDAAGSSRSDFAPDGVTTVYDGTVSQFDFTQLAVGDEVMVRVDMEVTTTSANQTADVDMTFAIGGTPFDIAFSRTQFKTAGTYQVTPQRAFYIGETVQPNPAEVRFRSDANATLIVRGWYVSVRRLGAL